MADKINSDEILVMRYEKSSNEEDNDCHESSEGQNLERGNQILPNHALNSGEMRAPLLPIEMHISELPNEMLTRIFEQLPMSDRYQVAMVCKRWRAVVYVPLFWKDVTLALNRWPVGHAGWLLNSLLLREFRKLRTSDHTVLRKVSRQHRLDLHSLTLVDYKFSSVTWSSSLLQPMINLTQLEIRNKNALDVRLNDDSIKLVAEHLKKLVTLKVTSCRTLTDRSLEYIAMGLSELKHLSVGKNIRFTDVGVGYLSGIGLNPPPTNLSRLQCLGLHCRYGISVTNLAIHYLCIGQPTIQQLDLFFHGGYSDPAIRCLGNMTKLRHLSISGSSWDGSGLVVLADAHLPITYLRLNASSYSIDEALEHVGRLNQLSTLILEGGSVSDAGLERLVRCGDSSIRILNILRCYSITDDGMRHVAQLQQLQELHFLVGDVGLAHLADAQSPVANVSCRHDVTDVGLRHLARLPKLQFLMFDRSDISNHGLEEFMANVVGPLTELKLASNNYSPIVPVRASRNYLNAGTLSCVVARRLPSLTRLWLRRSQVDDEGMKAAALLPWLQSLFVDGKDVIGSVRS